MTTATKARVVTAGLILFTLWPVVHMVLVARYDLSPWKLAGWGMYAAPRPNYRGMGIYGYGPDGVRRRLSAPTAEIADEAGRFLERYRWLRQLTAPDTLAARVRARHPEWTRLEIVVYRTHVDPDTGMVVMKEYTYDYDD